MLLSGYFRSWVSSLHLRLPVSLYHSFFCFTSSLLSSPTDCPIQPSAVCFQCTFFCCLGGQVWLHLYIAAVKVAVHFYYIIKFRNIWLYIYMYCIDILLNFQVSYSVSQLVFSGVCTFSATTSMHVLPPPPSIVQQPILRANSAIRQVSPGHKFSFKYCFCPGKGRGKIWIRSGLYNFAGSLIFKSKGSESLKHNSSLN